MIRFEFIFRIRCVSLGLEEGCGVRKSGIFFYGFWGRLKLVEIFYRYIFSSLSVFCDYNIGFWKYIGDFSRYVFDFVKFMV